MTLSSGLVYPIIFNVLIRIGFTVTNALMITDISTTYILQIPTLLQTTLLQRENTTGKL